MNEQPLRDALRAVEPPPGFADRVLARHARASRASRAARWRLPLALAASLLVAGVALWAVHQQSRETERGLLAAEQLRAALEITSTQLERVHRSLEPHI